jgi:hypothetical protein
VSDRHEVIDASVKLATEGDQSIMPFPDARQKPRSGGWPLHSFIQEHERAEANAGWTQIKAKNHA